VAADLPQAFAVSVEDAHLPGAPANQADMSLRRGPLSGRCALELEQGAHRVHLHLIDVLDLVALVFGPNSDLPDIESDADAVERVGAGRARARSRRAGFGFPGQHPGLA